MRPAVGIAVALALCAGATAPANAQVFLTQDQALDLAFPDDARLERRTAYLSQEQLERARALAGRAVSVEQTIVPHYVAVGAGGAVGVAYFDAHRVRTLPEVIMVVVGPDERVRRIEVLKFAEPPDYQAPRGWLDQFPSRRLDDALSVKGEIANITGATLTATAVTDAVRRVLALHRVIRPFDDAGEATRSGTGPVRTGRGRTP